MQGHSTGRQVGRWMGSFSTYVHFQFCSTSNPKCLRNKGAVSSFPNRVITCVSVTLVRSSVHAPSSWIIISSPASVLKQRVQRRLSLQRTPTSGMIFDPSAASCLNTSPAVAGHCLWMQLSPPHSLLFSLFFVFLQPACDHRFKRPFPVDRSSFLAFMKPLCKSYCTAEEASRRFESQHLCANLTDYRKVLCVCGQTTKERLDWIGKGPGPCACARFRRTRKFPVT